MRVHTPHRDLIDNALGGLRCRLLIHIQRVLAVVNALQLHLLAHLHSTHSPTPSAHPRGSFSFYRGEDRYVCANSAALCPRYAPHACRPCTPPSAPSAASPLAPPLLPNEAHLLLALFLLLLLVRVENSSDRLRTQSSQSGIMTPHLVHRQMRARIGTHAEHMLLASYLARLRARRCRSLLDWRLGGWQVPPAHTARHSR